MLLGGSIITRLMIIAATLQVQYWICYNIIIRSVMYVPQQLSWKQMGCHASQPERGDQAAPPSWLCTAYLTYGLRCFGGVQKTFHAEPWVYGQYWATPFACRTLSAGCNIDTALDNAWAKSNTHLPFQEHAWFRIPVQYWRFALRILLFQWYRYQAIEIIPPS